MQPLKICFAGLGSIGKRHLKNLSSLLQERGIPFCVDALRSRPAPLEPEIECLLCRQAADMSALQEQYDILFITNPTSVHYRSLAELLPRTKNAFIEKPLFEHTGYALSSLPCRPDGIYYVAAPLRFTGVFQCVQKFVKENRVRSARALCSSYLPNWRKDVDYRTVYSAHRELGGGVALDLIHEWDYLKALFGMPEKLYTLQGQYSGLQIDSDDLAVYIACYPDKTVEIHLDYFGCKERRNLELLTDGSLVTADFIARTVTVETAGSRYLLPVEEGDFYRREMGYFLDLCLGVRSDNQNDLRSAFQTLKLVKGNLE